MRFVPAPRFSAWAGLQWQRQRQPGPGPRGLARTRRRVLHSDQLRQPARAGAERPRTGAVDGVLLVRQGRRRRRRLVVQRRGPHHWQLFILHFFVGGRWTFSGRPPRRRQQRRQQFQQQPLQQLVLLGQLSLQQPLLLQQQRQRLLQLRLQPEVPGRAGHVFVGGRWRRGWAVVPEFGHGDAGSGAGSRPPVRRRLGAPASLRPWRQRRLQASGPHQHECAHQFPLPARSRAVQQRRRWPLSSSTACSGSVPSAPGVPGATGASGAS